MRLSTKHLGIPMSIQITVQALCGADRINDLKYN